MEQVNLVIHPIYGIVKMTRVTVLYLKEKQRRQRNSLLHRRFFLRTSFFIRKLLILSIHSLEFLT